MSDRHTDSPASLVVWSSTGRRLQFSMQDLAMPARIKELPNAAFYEKQWDIVAGFWRNRILKEAALQHMTVEDIVSMIEKDIDKRWHARRTEQALYKRKKRLLASSGGAAGTPSPSVLLTNVCALSDYEEGSDASRQALLTALAERVSAVAREPLSAVKVLIDSTVPGVVADSSTPSAKRQRTQSSATGEAGSIGDEQEGEPRTSAPAFDDRVAVLCTLSSKDKAALTIAHLHGSVFDGRAIVCRFWGA